MVFYMNHLRKVSFVKINCVHKTIVEHTKEFKIAVTAKLLRISRENFCCLLKICKYFLPCLW